MSITRALFAKVVAILELLMGRRNLVRLARTLTMASRLDVPNSTATNGELLVQQRVLDQMGARKAVAFDVGANVGEWSRVFLERAGDRDIQIHAFEPASATFASLRQNFPAHENRMHLVNQALSCRTGTAEFFIVGDGSEVNSLHTGLYQTQGHETVTLNTVDQYCRESSIEHIDFLKIDAEGHDYSVLEGAKAMLEAHAISVVQFEYNQRWIEPRHFLKDVFDLMLPLQYCLGKVTPRGIEFYPSYHFELESYREGNYLACLPDWKSRFPQVKWWNLE